MKTNVFRERSLCVSSDFNEEMMKYLFLQGKELKETMSVDNWKKLDKFRINNPYMRRALNPDFLIYDAFFENSTRTQKSTEAAVAFHNVHFKQFDPSKSSAKKHESLADTFIQTLAGYGGRISILRTNLEGVCRWLDIKGKEFYEHNKIEFKPAFINAGDGKHEHPTQELLDEFTFLEDHKWNDDEIHVALIGDLLHGRTVHSKAQGLKTFKNVKVDLIAPEILQMPPHYVNTMKGNGFQVRIFESLEEYYSQKDVAKTQYFTRPQLERMGSDIEDEAPKLRPLFTLSEDLFLKFSSVLESVKLYHPFPRHRKHPTLPEFLDLLPQNGYTNQSANGKIMRIILTSAIAGRIGEDYEGAWPEERIFVEDFINLVAENKSLTPGKNLARVGVIDNGLVIDHLLKGQAPKVIDDYMKRVRDIMGWFPVNGGGSYWDKSLKTGELKGFMKFHDQTPPTESELKKLAALTGGCTVNIIKDGIIAQKYRLGKPPRVYGLEGTSCLNDKCVSNPIHVENVTPEFIRSKNELLCAYCDTPHETTEIWRT